MALQVEDIDDIAVSTLENVGRGKFTQIAQELPDYEVWGYLLKRQKRQFEGGLAIRLNVMHTLSGAARHVGLYSQDVLHRGDVLTQGSIPWRHSETSYMYDRREVLINSGSDPEEVVNIIVVLRLDAMLDFVKLLEDTWFSKPADSSDNETPYGLPYWVVKNSVTGFNGGNPDGFAAGAGNIDQSVYANWANYTFAYTSVTKADLVKKMRTAYRACNFKSPVPGRGMNDGNGRKYRIYVNEATISTMEDLGEAQNENLGRDLASMDGQMVFHGNPIVYVAKLNADTSNPIYGVDFNQHELVFLKGNYMHETGPDKVGNSHNTKGVHVDLSWNTRCKNRRTSFVGYVA